MQPQRPQQPQHPQQSQHLQRPQHPQEIAVLVSNDISSFHLSVSCLVFEDRVWAGLLSYNLWICAGKSARKGGLRTTTGLAVQTDLILEGAARTNVLIVPSWRDTQECPPAAMVNAVWDAYEHDTTVIGLCLGAFVLAEAGVLDGHGAATH